MAPPQTNQPKTDLSSISLNQSQTAAVSDLSKALLHCFTKPKQGIEYNTFRLHGGAGTGKTTVVQHVIKKLLFEQHRISLSDSRAVLPVICAPTHVATSVLQQKCTDLPNLTQIQTIHSFLNVKVVRNFKTGKESIKSNFNPLTVFKGHTILVIDEYTMVDDELLAVLKLEYSKAVSAGFVVAILFVGDPYQLAPVNGGQNEVVTDSTLFTSTLIVPVRNSEHVALLEVCDTLVKCVRKSMLPPPFPESPKVIDHMNGPTLQGFIERQFRLPEPNTSILCYTNAKVNSYNHHIRLMRGYVSPQGDDALPYKPGEHIISGNRVMYDKAFAIQNQSHHVITAINELNLSEKDSIRQYLNSNFKFNETVLHGSKLLAHSDAVIIDHLCMLTLQPEGSRDTSGRFQQKILTFKKPDYKKALLKDLAKAKLWRLYYYIKDTTLDVNFKEALTIHKSQGSTYETVIIDLNDIRSSLNFLSLDEVTRLLYVAFSRATSRVILRGTLHK